MIVTDKISSYMDMYKSYNPYMYKVDKTNKLDLSTAIPCYIIDESYEYITIIDNMMYLRQNTNIYKFNISNLSKARVNILISYLKRG